MGAVESVASKVAHGIGSAVSTVAHGVEDVGKAVIHTGEGALHTVEGGIKDVANVVKKGTGIVNAIKPLIGGKGSLLEKAGQLGKVAEAFAGGDISVGDKAFTAGQAKDIEDQLGLTGKPYVVILQSKDGKPVATLMVRGAYHSFLPKRQVSFRDIPRTSSGYSLIEEMERYAPKRSRIELPSNQSEWMQESQMPYDDDDDEIESASD